MTPFELFKVNAQQDMRAYREKSETKAAFSLSNVTTSLQNLQNKLSGHILMYYFGEQLGMHLWEKFVVGHNRNLLSWLNNLTSEYRFYILYQVENDPHFFFH